MIDRGVRLLSWGVAEARACGEPETGGRTTRASVCRPPLWKTAPPSCLWRLPCGGADTESDWCEGIVQRGGSACLQA
jgi:hypothetical protein